MQPSRRAAAASGPLVLADISGYTSFLADVAEAHRDDAFAGGRIPDAYALVSSLLDGIIAGLVPPFTLAKLEGDAVFAYATSSDLLPRGDAALACLRACYASYRERLAGAESVWSCRCDACARVTTLDLKFVLHAGPFVVQPMGGGVELVGPEVVVVHRLLKSGAAELVGGRPYALVTEAAAAHLAMPLDDAPQLVERYEYLPPVAARVVALV